MNGSDRPLVVVGDALLDRDIDGEATRLAPDAPAPVVEAAGERARPGGAALAACLAARGGRDVVLVTALGDGEADRELRARLEGRVRLAAFPLAGTVPVKTRVRAGGRPLVRVDRGGGTPGAPGREALAALRDAEAVLVADYGGGVAEALRPRLAAAARRGPLTWDPHPRGGPPVPGARLVTPNAAEAEHFAAALTGPDGPLPGGDGMRAHAARAAALTRHWRAVAVAVTLAGRGALLSRGTAGPMLLPAPHTCDGDPCGAGDCFAAAAACALADGALPEEAVQRAVAAATAFVARGDYAPDAPDAAGPGTGGPRRDPFALAGAVRARGGTVVATGGCFDLLHAGHVGLLESARRVGDCLIVCLNSDASVTRLKGPGRPLVPAADRARVLTGLGCVDAVAVFDEDTPERVLRGLRPHVWVKGGDYTADALPEAAALASWGGQALVLPYLDGRSTTDLARRAARAQRAVAPPAAEVAG
ncbi:D-glycero-beta-D-manno-heptose 1-phosphate adenylyltransferase [Streptomyces capparidis]